MVEFFFFFFFDEKEFLERLEIVSWLEISVKFVFDDSFHRLKD